MADFSAQRRAVVAADAVLAQALYKATVAPSAGNQTALGNAQQAAGASRDALNKALTAALATAGDAASSLNGGMPIALFPVRLETRYARAAAPTGTTLGPTANAGTLQIRVYPDDILALTHEPELTDDEWQAGRAYWTAGDTPSSWSALLAQYPAPRAAWIVSQTNTANRPPARAASWTRPSTGVLPDKFAAFAFRNGGVVATVAGAPIPEPLTLTMSPVLDAAQRTAIPGSSLQIDSDLLWTVQFAAAKNFAGMALELPVTANDWKLGFDLLLVVGTKGTFSPAEASQHIQRLLDGHHYTRGLALLGPGTPTSNMPGAPVAYPPPDPAGASSFAIERGTPASGVGLLVASALGISPSVVAHLDETGLQSDSAAKAMLTALWPATLGYHLEQMMAPADTTLPAPFDSNAIAAAYGYTRTNVRPAGPLPAFRVGGVPYALLPATSVTRRAAAAPNPLATALNALHASLLTASDQTPRIDPGSSDPDGDLVNVLRLNASSSSFQVQVLIGAQLQAKLAALPGLDGASLFSTQANQATTANALLHNVGLPSANTPHIAQASFGATEDFRGVLVEPGRSRIPAARHCQLHQVDRR